MASDRAFGKTAPPAAQHFHNTGRSTPAVPLSSPDFTKFHLGLSRGAYHQDYLPLRSILGKTPPNLGMVQVISPTREHFLYHLQRVGQKYGWDKRRKYQEDNWPTIDEMMARPDTALYVFNVDGKDAGFCLTTGIFPPKSQSQGINKNSVLDIFRRINHLPNDSRAAEIYKFGLYDEFTDQGYGNYFLGKILHQIFDVQKYDIVYLDTRSTNHRGVLPFYAKNGVNYFYQEDLQSDLVGNPADYAEPQETQEIPVPNGDPPPAPAPPAQ